MFLNKYRIAIVVPLYNVGEYLTECLDSIKEQTFENWECFIVDDGSTDDSLRIAKEYSLKDDRFKVYSKNNEGVSATRNYALDVICRESNGYSHVAFVDSDDKIDSEMYEKLIRVISETDSDLALCGIYNFDSNGRVWQKPKKSRSHKENISQDEFVKLIFGVDDWRGKLCSGGHIMKLLCSYSLIEEIRFIEDRKSVEDELFCLEIASKAKNCVVLSEALYGYRRRTGSLTGSVKFVDMLIKCRRQCLPIAKKISEKSYYIVLAAYVNAMINKSKVIRERVEVSDVLEKDIDVILRGRYLSLKQKLVFYLLRKKTFLSNLYFFVRGGFNRRF